MGSETARLAREAQSGNRASFEALVRRCLPLVYGVAYERTRSAHDAEDVTQEVFLEAHQSMDRLESPESVRGWLAGIACHKAIDCLRRRRSAEPLDQVPEPADAEAEMPDGASMMNEAAEAIQGVIDSLPEVLRDVVRLRYQQELSYKEIARALGISTSLVGERLFRARAALEERLAARGATP